MKEEITKEEYKMIFEALYEIERIVDIKYDKTLSIENKESSILKFFYEVKDENSFKEKLRNLLLKIEDRK